MCLERSRVFPTPWALQRAAHTSALRSFFLILRRPTCPGLRIATQPNYDIWARNLSNGDVAVGLYSKVGKP